MNPTADKPEDSAPPNQASGIRAPLHVVRPRVRRGTAADRGTVAGTPFASPEASAFPAADWLATACRLLPGIRSAAVFETALGPMPRVLATWPAAGDVAEQFGSVAASAAARGEPITVTGPNPLATENARTVEVTAHPFRAAAHPSKVAVVCTSGATEAGLRRLAQHLEQCESWLRLLARAPQSPQPAAEHAVLQVIAQCLEQDTLRSSAMAVSAHLATHLGCERVAIALRHGDKLQLEAISRQGDFDNRSELARSIVAAMDEAIDQDASVRFPPSRGAPGGVAPAHEQLCQQAGTGAALTIPVSSQAELTGAVTFEHADAARFDPATIAFCEAAVGFIGPVLTARQRAERPLALALADRGRELLRRLLGPRHVVTKLVALSVAALVLLGALVHGDYRITAQAQLRGTVQRMVVAPIDGFIAEAPVRAGDEVKDGQVLATLDQRTLELEQVKLTSERERLRNEFRAAMAELDSVQVTVLRSKLDRATAELELVEEQLARTNIVAPFSGIVVSGDLTQSVGAPVRQGSTLFEVAPLDSYRVMLEVDERDIGDVAEGQQGQLVLAGFPGDRFGFVVERITPVSRVADGRNFFSLEASLLQTPPLLRPGMQGVAKLEVGPRRLGWIWTRRLTGWLTLQAWRWLPLD